MGTGGGFGRRQGQEPVLVFYGKDCMKNTPFTHLEAMASVTHSCLSGIPEKWTLGRERGACVSNLGKLKILICFFFLSLSENLLLFNNMLFGYLF